MLMPAATVTISGDHHKLTMHFAGSLNLYNISSLWKQCSAAQEEHHPVSLTIDLTQVEGYDESGINMLVSLENKQKALGYLTHFNGMSANAQELYQLISQTPAMPASPHQSNNPISLLGQYTVEILGDLKSNITFIGELLVKLPRILMHPSQIRWRDISDITQEVGPKAFAIIALIGFLLGIILSFQGSVALKVFGAQIYVANLVSLSLFKELAPLMTAIVLIGRSASAFAAELGTMKINQEVDALKTMGLEPIQFLVLPRLIAGIIMMPILTLFMSLFGLIGCDVVMASMGFSFHIYISQLQSALTIGTIFSGLVKALVFGIIISIIGCLYGLKASLNASAVGSATTKAVVTSIVMVAIFDGIFSIIYYVYGI
jgi:phospholipid/cholesterol/gamma-HCH transport system permease protein